MNTQLDDYLRSCNRMYNEARLGQPLPYVPVILDAHTETGEYSVIVGETPILTGDEDTEPYEVAEEDNANVS